ncbi:MAG: TM2 domain-containing protein [Fusobacteriaceae bacterium]
MGNQVISKVVYILVAIFFGSLGIHRFLIGKTISAIFMFLFCWTGIPTIVSIIDIIIAAGMPTDSQGNIQFNR